MKSQRSISLWFLLSLVASEPVVAQPLPGKAVLSSGAVTEAERVTCRRVRIVRCGIEEQIGQTMPRQMRFRRHPWREDKPFRRNSSLAGFVPEIAHSCRIVFEQPQHTIGHVAQQPHPNRKNGGRDLVDIVETTEDECSIR